MGEKRAGLYNASEKVDWEGFWGLVWDGQVRRGLERIRVGRVQLESDATELWTESLVPLGPKAGNKGGSSKRRIDSRRGPAGHAWAYVADDGNRGGCGVYLRVRVRVHFVSSFPRLCMEARGFSRPRREQRRSGAAPGGGT